MRPRWFVGGAAAVSLLVGTAAAWAGLKPGETLDQSTWEKAKDLLPPEMLRHYREGRYASPIGEMKAIYSLDESVLAAGEKNAGKFKIDEHGSLVEAASGRIPEYNFGLPFPKLDPADPQLAQKIMWNFEYASWSNGSNRAEARLIWLTAGSNTPDREITLDTATMVIEGGRRRQDDPMQRSRLDRNLMLEPADINGMVALSWRFKDATKRDNVWAYVPGLRRVRAISPANRSDGTMGSEMTPDDGFNAFDAKPEDFTFKVVEAMDQLTAFVPEALEGRLEFLPSRSGQGWHLDTPLQRLGFREAGWTGVPWAILAGPLVVRPMWMIDITPKDRYYVYGKIRLWVDRETYKAATFVKHDWKGAAVAVGARAIGYGRAPDGYRYTQFSGGGQGGSYVENLPMNRATAGEAVEDKAAWNDVDPRLDPEMYSPERLVQMGR